MRRDAVPELQEALEKLDLSRFPEFNAVFRRNGITPENQREIARAVIEAYLSPVKQAFGDTLEANGLGWVYCNDDGYRLANYLRQLFWMEPNQAKR